MSLISDFIHANRASFVVAVVAAIVTVILLAVGAQLVRATTDSYSYLPVVAKNVPPIISTCVWPECTG